MSKLYSFLLALVVLQELMLVFLLNRAIHDQKFRIVNCSINVKKVSTFCQSLFTKYASNFLSLQNIGRPTTPGRPSG